MLAEWSVECSAEDPVLVVPWNDPKTAAEFIDLRAHPYDLHRIPEAEQHQPLMQALRALNATRSPVFTAKCDAWPLTPDELEHLRFNLDLDPTEAPTTEPPAGFASYIDLIWHERSLFTSFPQQEQVLRRLTRHAAALDHPSAALECILRTALVDLDGPQEGYALSLYVKALGPDPQTAWQEWASALAATVALLRGKDLFR
jgi:hypothetical protein